MQSGKHKATCKNRQHCTIQGLHERRQSVYSLNLTAWGMQRQDEGNGAFVQRVQEAIVSELNVSIVELTMPQKAKLVAAAQTTK